MSERAWKRTERMVARRLKGERIPVTGRARGSAPDVFTPWACVEVKHRKTLPQWLLEAVDQAYASAQDDQLPVVVLHEAGMPHDRDLVVMRLRDFTAWHGELERADEG
jgi:hypothetical protein